MTKKDKSNYAAQTVIPKVLHSAATNGESYEFKITCSHNLTLLDDGDVGCQKCNTVWAVKNPTIHTYEVRPLEESSK